MPGLNPSVEAFVVPIFITFLTAVICKTIEYIYTASILKRDNIQRQMEKATTLCDQIMADADSLYSHMYYHACYVAWRRLDQMRRKRALTSTKSTNIASTSSIKSQRFFTPNKSVNFEKDDDENSSVGASSAEVMKHSRIHTDLMNHTDHFISETIAFEDEEKWKEYNAALAKWRSHAVRYETEMQGYFGYGMAEVAYIQTLDILFHSLATKIEEIYYFYEPAYATPLLELGQTRRNIRTHSHLDELQTRDELTMMFVDTKILITALSDRMIHCIQNGFVGTLRIGMKDPLEPLEMMDTLDRAMKIADAIQANTFALDSMSSTGTESPGKDGAKRVRAGLNLGEEVEMILGKDATGTKEA